MNLPDGFLVSVIIRTYNESRYLDELLSAIGVQVCEGFSIEIVLVDSGSSDGTLDIAKRHGARIVHIRKSEFTFGRSLNIGCSAAFGQLFVLVSGHCIPTSPTWIKELVHPLRHGFAECTYGKQVGRDTSKFSEERLFEKYFPTYSKPTQDGFFCNNANAAVTRQAWERFRYNEDLTGLEDMYLARQIYEAGGNIAYVSSAGVFHIHDESWQQVRVRYEREALALQQIMPNVHFNFIDFAVYFLAAVIGDWQVALQHKSFWEEAGGIVGFRFMQYWGTFRGSRRHRRVSASVKHSYFYPKDLEREKYVKNEDCGPVAHEGQQ